jgi:transcription elongation factor GreA
VIATSDNERIIVKPMYMTEKGFAKIQAQLDRLRNEDLPELAEHLHDAQTGSDLVDNTEFIMLREEFVFINSRIRELEEILRNAQLIERGEPDGRVHLGNTVVIQTNGDLPETYTIVGSTETNPEEGLISNECPLGQALLEHTIGEDIVVTTPDGELRYRIIAVT